MNSGMQKDIPFLFLYPHGTTLSLVLFDTGLQPVIVTSTNSDAFYSQLLSELLLSCTKRQFYQPSASKTLHVFHISGVAKSPS